MVFVGKNVIDLKITLNIYCGFFSNKSVRYYYNVVVLNNMVTISSTVE